MTAYDKEIGQEVTKREMTMNEIKALPGLIGVMASQHVVINGEYKCSISGVKTWIVLKV